MIRLGSDKNIERGQKRMCRAVQGGSWEVVEKSTIFIRKIGNRPPKAKLGKGSDENIERGQNRMCRAVRRKLEGGGEINYQASAKAKLGIRSLPKQSWEGV